jgi:hypothetical protein
VEYIVKKDELLGIVQANRETHRAVYLDAVEGYRVRALALLEHENQVMSGTGKPKELRILLNRPEDHTAEYDRIIKGLQMDTRDEIPLPERLFAQFVMDQWDWKDSWLRISSRYAAASTQKAYDFTEEDDV